MDIGEETKAVLRLLEENPDISRISPDGKRLYMIVEGVILCITGPAWTYMSEEQINAYLELARVDFERFKEVEKKRDT